MKFLEMPEEGFPAAGAWLKRKITKGGVSAWAQAQAQAQPRSARSRFAYAPPRVAVCESGLEIPGLRATVGRFACFRQTQTARHANS